MTKTVLWWNTREAHLPLNQGEGVFSFSNQQWRPRVNLFGQVKKSIAEKTS
jgi:hypothetical protein